MEFRTLLKNFERQKDFKHSHSITLIGSCFSDNIGNKLSNALFHTDINPFGTVYNPASILNEIERIISGNSITEDELFFANGMWNHFGFHSHFSKADKYKAIEYMNNRLRNAHTHLKNSNWVIVTFGTVFVYENKACGKIVSNCHKLPAKEFNRRMLTITETTSYVNRIAEVINNFAPQAKIIFTVSPIRHIADGLEQNQLSKSVLRVAVNEIITRHSSFCDYFPAYEIMMDDLRDYRFYATDMVHPSEVAIEYIWNTFKGAYFDDNTAQTVSRCERIYKRLSHRPMTDNIEAITRFKQETQEILSKLTAEYPYLKDIPQLSKSIE